MSLNRLRSAGYMTNWAARLFAVAIEQRLKPHGIAPAYLPIFFALGQGEALSQKALTQFAAVEQPTMAATLNRMERDGLIQRTSDPADRRSSLISLSEIARSKMDVVFQATSEVNEAALSRLSQDERVLFVSMLEKIVDCLELSQRTHRR